MKVKYKDDVMTAFDSDVEKIRSRLLMYIGVMGSAGANHVCREAINNHIDECSKDPSVTPGDTIWIEFIEKDDVMISSDNGRGINPTEIVPIYTTLNMGSNMTRSHGYTLGENGVGSLCINALARECTIQSFRSLHEKVTATFQFREGKLISETSEPNTSKHGLLVMYKPSRKVLGRETHIDIDAMWEWIHSFKYRMSPKITIHVKATRLDGKVQEDTIKAVPFSQIIVDNNPSLLTPVESLSFNGEMEEEFGGTIQNRTFHLDMAFGYLSDDSVPYSSSFCNGAYTTDHGSHFDGVLQGITRYLRDQTTATISEKDREKLSIKPDDVQIGLSLSVNLMTDLMRLFVSQIKTKVDNIQLSKLLSNLVYEQLSSTITKNNLKQYTDMIKLNAKARIEATAIRQKTMKEQVGRWDRYSIPQLIPCASMDKTKTELYICEGLSAKGALRISRDAQTQAIFSVKGFPLNPYGKSISQILNNEEYKALIAAMGCGVGDSFNINKLKYSRIIIATDADADGWGIRSLLSAFYIILFPEIVMQRRLYVADPPLYQLDYKPQEYVTTKKIYQEICEKIYNRNWIHVEKGGSDWVPVEHSTLFWDTTNFQRLFRLTSIYRVHPKVMFNILSQTAKFIYDHKYPEELSQDDFQRMIREIKYVFKDQFREIYSEYRDTYMAFQGVYELKHMGIDLTYPTYHRLEPIIRVLVRMKPWKPIYLKSRKTGEVQLEIAEDAMKVMECVTAGNPRIKDRMKGLGQTDKDILTKTTMDPNTRTLIQIQIDDLNQALETIRILRGSSEEDLSSRKKMLNEFDIDPDDIDN